MIPVERWGDADAFWKAILCIERWGVFETFWHAQRKTSTLTNGSTGIWATRRPRRWMNVLGLINRTWLDVARYGEDARQLGYDDTSTGRLVTRWQLLLEKAREGRWRPSAEGCVAPAMLQTACTCLQWS